VVTVISRFRVRNGVEAEVRSAFINRPRLVEKTVGFCGLDVLTDAADPSVFLLLTRWTNEEIFRTWHRSEGHDQSREFMPRSLKLDASFTSLKSGKPHRRSAWRPESERCDRGPNGCPLAVADGIGCSVWLAFGSGRNNSHAKSRQRENFFSRSSEERWFQYLGLSGMFRRAEPA
jgi:heme-degrading monooxygenase HmoA